MSKKKKFSELPVAARLGIIGGAIIQLTLLAAAQRDLSRREDGQVRGPKLAWRAISFINFFGPLSYFIFGRKNDSR